MGKFKLVNPVVKKSKTRLKKIEIASYLLNLILVAIIVIELRKLGFK